MNYKEKINRINMSFNFEFLLNLNAVDISLTPAEFQTGKSIDWQNLTKIIDLEYGLVEKNVQNKLTRKFPRESLSSRTKRDIHNLSRMAKELFLALIMLQNDAFFKSKQVDGNRRELLLKENTVVFKIPKVLVRDVYWLGLAMIVNTLKHNYSWAVKEDYKICNSSSYDFICHLSEQLQSFISAEEFCQLLVPSSNSLFRELISKTRSKLRSSPYDFSYLKLDLNDRKISFYRSNKALSNRIERGAEPFLFPLTEQARKKLVKHNCILENQFRVLASKEKIKKGGVRYQFSAPTLSDYLSSCV